MDDWSRKALFHNSTHSLYLQIRVQVFGSSEPNDNPFVFNEIYDNTTHMQLKNSKFGFISHIKGSTVMGVQRYGF